MSTRKSRGRQKIEMTRMSKESNLLVTFSKRRSGLFKKASELCTLCGAEIAIIIFSPGKKAFSFGHPNVESIIERFLAPPPRLSATMSPTVPAALQMVEAHRNANVIELNMQLNELMGQMAEEKRRADELSRVMKTGRGGWWEGPVEEMGVGELEQLKAAMEELRGNVTRVVAEKMVEEPTSLALPPFLGVAPPGLGGGDGGGGFNDDVVERKVVNPHVGGLGQLCVTPHGYTLGFGHSFF